MCSCRNHLLHTQTEIKEKSLFPLDCQMFAFFFLLFTIPLSRWIHYWHGDGNDADSVLVVVLVAVRYYSLLLLDDVNAAFSLQILMIGTPGLFPLHQSRSRGMFVDCLGFIFNSSTAAYFWVSHTWIAHGHVNPGRPGMMVHGFCWDNLRQIQSIYFASIPK